MSCMCAQAAAEHGCIQQTMTPLTSGLCACRGLTSPAVPCDAQTVGRNAASLLDPQFSRGPGSSSGSGSGGRQGMPRTSSDWAATLDSCFELYGGSQAAEELEQLSSECAHICNRWAASAAVCLGAEFRLCDWRPVVTWRWIWGQIQGCLAGVSCPHASRFACDFPTLFQALQAERMRSCLWLVWKVTVNYSTR
jgi:hypothetical protein